MSAPQKPKRRHHHVWQLFLRPWTTDGTIWCLQNGRVFSTGTTTIAVENDFYKLTRLTREDVALIKMLFDKGHPLSKRNHAQLLNTLMVPFQLADQVRDARCLAEIEQHLNEYTSEVLEDYHMKVEASFIPALNSALNGDIGFYSDDERCIPFCFYFSIQYMRTKGIKERVIELCESDKSADLSRVWNVLVPMFASNMGLAFTWSASSGSLFWSITEREFRSSLAISRPSI